MVSVKQKPSAAARPVPNIVKLRMSTPLAQPSRVVVA
jgi:hypothetical protein